VFSVGVGEGVGVWVGTGGWVDMGLRFDPQAERNSTIRRKWIAAGD
jgi:hypothetical protein